MKTFNVPITHPYIQNLTDFDLAFIDWSTALDDPKLREKIENTVYDDEFDAWYNEQMQGDGGEDEDESEITPSSPETAQGGAKRPMPDGLPNSAKKAPENAKLGNTQIDSKTNDWEEVE